MGMKRVVIFGPGASGKSTLAVRLGEITGLPVIELDKIFWRPGLIASFCATSRLLERLTTLSVSDICGAESTIKLRAP